MRAKISNLPIYLVIGYITFTVFMFMFGPIDWPILSYVPVAAYMGAVLACICGGYFVGTHAKPVFQQRLNANFFIFFGGIAAIALLIPSSRIYTGRWPWEVFAALSDQKEAYSSLSQQLEITSGSRGVLVIIRTLVSPLVFAVIPLGVLYWRNLLPHQRALIVGTGLVAIIFSVLRGTTRELADIFVTGFAAFLISSARANGGWLPFVRNWGKIVTITALGAGIILALVGRTSARMGNSALTFCMGEGTVCPAFASPFYGRLSDGLFLGLVTITGYLSQGYYGLHLALHKSFVWTGGLGHSPALASVFKLLFPDSAFVSNSYSSRLMEDHWAQEYQWSTMLTWVASDVTFLGALVFVFIIGLILAYSWVDAVQGQDAASIVFCLVFISLFYLPLNNQLANTSDGYFTTLFWIFAWLKSRRQKPRFDNK